MHALLNKHLALISLTLLVACVPAAQAPLEEGNQQSSAMQAEQGESFVEEEPIRDEVPVIAERLLPSGFLEIGNRDAPIVLLLYTEHHCRYCKDFFIEQFPKLIAEYVNSGTLRLQIGILPLKKYAASDTAAIGMLCAATQSKGIAMHKLLFELGAKDEKTLLSHAATLELDTALFTQCLHSPDTGATVEREKSIARSLDVTLVPTLFLNGEKSVGLPYYADLKGMIDAKLR